MRLKQKTGIAVLMGLGLITGACSIVRTVLNGQALASDATYGGITNWFWRLFEVDLGLICACVPTLVPIWKWASKKIQKSSWISRVNNYTSRLSYSNGPPSFSRPSGKGISKPSKGSLGNVIVDRNGWQEKNVKQPKKAMLVSRTERALMGRAGHFDDMTTVKTETAPDVEPGTNTTAEGLSKSYNLTDAERAAIAQEWESSLRMPWMSNSRDNQPRRSSDLPSDIQIARNTSLTVTLEDTSISRPGHNPKVSTSKHALVSASSVDDTTSESIEMQQFGDTTEARRHGGLWNRVITAVSGGERNSGGSWKKMHTPKASYGQ